MGNKNILVCGAGGFIGGHLVNYLRNKGNSKIRAVDIKPFNEWFQIFDGVENLSMDLREKEKARIAVKDCNIVYDLAADMGGIGFIENNKAACMLSVLINTHLLMASKEFSVEKYFYASSACVYNAEKQKDTNVIPLKEDDAYPAMPEDGYGWEKLFSERMCRHFREDYGMNTKMYRFHNVYGPHGTYDGGREKAPAAICRKVIRAKISNSNKIEIWGNGEQTRSFMYIDDCITGLNLLMNSEVYEPLNLGSSELVTINQLVDMVEDIAEIKLKREYNLNAPKGVNGRNSDNTKIHSIFNWEPSIPLREGMENTYRWIYDQIISNRPSKG